VEFRYTPLVAGALLPGLCYERLRALDWEAPASASPRAIELGFDVIASASPLPVLSKAGFRLQLLADRIAFNITGRYPGWSQTYRPLLQTTIRQLLDPEILQFHRVGLRFINEFPATDVFATTDRFTAGEPLAGWAGRGHAIAWDVQHGEVVGKVNMASNVTLSSGEAGSLLDIDLFENLPVEQAAEPTYIDEVIERLHLLNKQVVFGHLLPPDFVKKFGAHYS
jgi:uncharacterized protein (TIGR04255 family)